LFHVAGKAATHIDAALATKKGCRFPVAFASLFARRAYPYDKGQAQSSAAERTAIVFQAHCPDVTRIPDNHRRFLQGNRGHLRPRSWPLERNFVVHVAGERCHRRRDVRLGRAPDPLESGHLHPTKLLVLVAATTKFDDWVIVAVLSSFPSALRVNAETELRGRTTMMSRVVPGKCFSTSASQCSASFGSLPPRTNGRSLSFMFPLWPAAREMSRSATAGRLSTAVKLRRASISAA